jgi:predicted ATPase
MLKKLTIRNFKAIQDMTIEFTPLTVLIGGNSCGKSTVLQAIDFLRSAAFRDIPEYLREKGWKIEELKSQLNRGQDKPIEFIALFDFIIEHKVETIQWTFIVNQNNGSWNIKEEMIKPEDNTILFSRGFGKGGPMVAGGPGAYAGSPTAVAHDINEILLQSSWLKYLQLVNEKPELLALKQFLMETTYFGLLSPDNMRNSDKSNNTNDIGIGGISLAPFIYCMVEELKDKLNDMVSQLVGFTVQVNTIDLGGRIELFIDEKFNDSSTRINKDHISDGLLRIVAFVAIALQRKLIPQLPKWNGDVLSKDGISITIDYIDDPHGIILLDEIENGINPYLTEKVTEMLNEITKKTERQIILTTHSPIILNDLDPNDVVLLWKADDGSIHSRPLFSIEELKDMLEFVNPGDAWMNIRQEDLLAKANDRFGVSKK